MKDNDRKTESHKKGKTEDTQRERRRERGKTVARQHTTSVGIQQGIQFLRFVSPGLQWKY